MTRKKLSLWKPWGDHPYIVTLLVVCTLIGTGITVWQFFISTLEVEQHAQGVNGDNTGVLTIGTGNVISTTINNISQQSFPSDTPSPTAIPTLTPGPTTTPNAYSIDVLLLLSEGRSILKQSVVNLDNQGPEEIVVSSVIPNTIEYELAAFAYINAKGWTSIMRLTRAIENSCAFYTGEYGLAKMTGDETIQVIPWSQCGTGALLEFEIYEYRGLGFMNRIYHNSPENPDDRDYKWMNSMPEFDDNYHFFVSHVDGIYQYLWQNSELVGMKQNVDPGSSGVTVEYWLDGTTNTVNSTLPELQIQVGSYLYLNQRENSGLETFGDVRIQIEGDDILTWINGTMLYAEQPGTCIIYIRGWEDSPIVIIHVTESDVPGSP